MTLDEAIRDLELIKNPLWGNHSKNWMDAVQLGIEALKRIKECRLIDHTIKEDYLPGEIDQ